MTNAGRDRRPVQNARRAGQQRDSGRSGTGNLAPAGPARPARSASWRETLGPGPTARAWRVSAAFSAPPAIVVGLVLLFVVGWLAGLLGFVVIAVALVWWTRFAGDREVAAAVGGRDADPVRDARLCNLIEGLAVGAGVRQPRLLVVDSPGVNALAAGSRPDRAVLAVTSGLLESLDRIEMEAVLAEQLFLIRHNETVPGTALVATFGLGSGLGVAADRDTAADLGAVSLTRYPPGLAAALEKAGSKGSAVTGQGPRTAHLWMIDPRDPPVAARGRIPLTDRIEALTEL